MIRFIENVGDFFSTNYFDEDFNGQVQQKSGYDAEGLKELNKAITSVSDAFFRLKQGFLEGGWRIKDQIEHTHRFHSKLLNKLGYEGDHPEYHSLFHISEDEVIPVRHTLRRSDGSTQLMILEMQAQIKVGDKDPDGLFEQSYHSEEGGAQSTRQQRYHRSQWEPVFSVPEGLHLSPSIINEVISTLFLLDREDRPRYILLLAGNKLYVMEAEKWFRGAYMEFDLEILFDEHRASRSQHYFATLCLLCGKTALASTSDQLILEKLDEESHKNANKVTKDLKEGVIYAVEALANEALYYLSKEEIAGVDTHSAQFAQEIRDDCLTMVYRLLFVFYAESREELSILPISDREYQKGYSLEMLRDLELMPLLSESSRNGFFFHESISRLFHLLSHGYKENVRRSNKESEGEQPQLDRSFTVRKIDSPLFQDKALHWLGKVKIRNSIWQQIILKLSLSKEERRKNRGRISYANLDINQLGSVYESLLSYRGFYASEDMLEVHNPKTPEETYLIPRSRRGDFKEDEIKKDDEGKDAIIREGTFVYRLNGRDRQKSASYYTPQSLTQLTVKYALKGILERVEQGKMKATELLGLKLLEPAMGAAAFHNEMINQIAEAYLRYRQEERKKKINPNTYLEELQKVKAYIATHNVYGVDLNPTAIELGKLSLWLNGMHEDMETPFFGNRLVCGNAVVGGWLKTYRSDQVSLEKDRKGRLVRKEWWKEAASMISFNKKGIKRKENEIYHFLLPDANMLASRNIRLLRQEHDLEVKRATKWLSKFCSPFVGNDLIRLKRLSARVDILLEEYFSFLKRLNLKTHNHYDVWGFAKDNEQIGLALHSYEDKERLNQERLNKDAAFYRLKLVMDYWCALWFWDVREARHLPDREQYLSDLEQILGKEIPRKDFYDSQPRLMTMAGDQLSFDDVDRVAERTTQAIVDEVETSDLFEGTHRLELVRNYSHQYRFFHPQLEFLDVFWERGGFDLICGNPPWISVGFDETGVVSESYPEAVVRKFKAPKVSQLAKHLLETDIELSKLYIKEEIDATSTKTFISSKANYPFISGGRNNLYKCILENGFKLTNNDGFLALVHPEGIYDDPNGAELRKEAYSRLGFHFQFVNELVLFAEVDHHTKYGVHVYRGKSGIPDFFSINSLFHPSTVNGCFLSSITNEICGGYKILDTNTGRMIWNTKPHPDRLVTIDQGVLEIFARTFEDSEDWQGAKLVSVHSKQILKVLEKLSRFPTKVADFEYRVSDGFNETIAVKEGVIKRETKYPEVDKYELIYSGPHFFVANPFYKTPREICSLNSHYDEIDLTQIPEDFVPRTNYVPAENLENYKNRIKGFKIGETEDGKPIYDRWIDHYKVAMRAMLSQAGERTLIPVIIPPNVGHIHAVKSITFDNSSNIVLFAGICSSTLIDFYIKTMGKGGLYDNAQLENIPRVKDSIKVRELIIRSLRLNALSSVYGDLWNDVISSFQENEIKQGWSSKDPRLNPTTIISSRWVSNAVLRNHFERRQALVEIDVIVAQAVGLTLDELIMIYEVQFPVLQQNEEDTWYDKTGNIVFTCSRGLTGVGVDRKTWNSIKDLQAGETYEHTIDPAKNELYGGQTITYHAPFDRCDRVEDYRQAWAHFEQVFSERVE